jgi:cytochrome c oxidase subunit 2
VRHRLIVIVAAVVALGLGATLAACGSDSGGGPEVKLSAAGERGKTVAKEQGCISCHTADGSKGTGPTWKGLAGSTVTLDDGSTVVADDDYLREAILQSRAQVVDGYANIMPVYDGEMTDAEVADVIAYLHDLAPADSGSDSGGGSGS